MYWKELFNGKSCSQRDHVLNLTKSGVFLEYPTISSPGQGREKSDVQIVSVRTLPTPDPSHPSAGNGTWRFARCFAARSLQSPRARTGTALWCVKWDFKSGLAKQRVGCDPPQRGWRDLLSTEGSFLR